MNAHFGCTAANSVRFVIVTFFTEAFGLISVHNERPQQPCSTEFGNFHKIIASHTKIEFDFFGSNRGFYAGFNHIGEIFVTPGQGIAEFLSAIRTGITQRHGINANNLIERQSGTGSYRCFGFFNNNFFGQVLTL